MSGGNDPAVPDALGHLRAICRYCDSMIRIDTTYGAQWVNDDYLIEEEPV